MRLALLILTIAASQLPAQERPPAASERIDVTAVEIVLDVRDQRGNVPREVGPADFRVLEGGIPVTVLSVEPLVGPTAASTAGPDATRAAAVPWHTVLYFDQALSTPQTMQIASQGLASRAEELTQLGHVEVVVSDGTPRRLVEPTRDATAVRDALGRVRRFPGYDRLRDHRSDFLYGFPSESRARAAIAEEQRMIRSMNAALQQFLGARTSAQAGAVILVSDGWDLDPVDFYSQYAQNLDRDEDESDRVLPDLEGLDTWAANLGSMRGDAANRTLIVETSVSGWTVFPLGGGVPWSSNRDASENLSGGLPPDHTSRGSVQLIVHPTDPLLALAEATGGAYSRHPRSFDAVVDSMRNRFVLTYQSSRPIDGELRRVEIQPVREGWKAQSRQWVSDAPPESLSATRIRSLALDRAERGDLPVRAEVRLGDDGHHELLTTIELRRILPLLRQRDQTRLRLTVRAVDGEGRETIAHQEIALEDPGREATVIHVAPLRLRDSTTSVSVVVEEYLTGSWGGASIYRIPVIIPREELVRLGEDVKEAAC